MNKPLRALLLAAGLGTRLRPITNTTPKCLVKVSGEPLLARWLRQLERAGCEAVLVNTHYLAEEVEAFLKGWTSSTMTVRSIHETELLGTGGTLLANQAFFKGATGLLIHADNAMAGGLGDFLAAHRRRQDYCLLTMLTFSTDTPSSCGIVEIDNQQVVQAFHEKVVEPPGNSKWCSVRLRARFPGSPQPDESNANDFSTEVIRNYAVGFKPGIPINHIWTSALEALQHKN